MTDPTTLVELLQRRADAAADRVGFTFLADDGTTLATRTYGELADRSLAVAALLRDWAAPGSRALIVCPPGPEFLDAFFGCILAGLIAVPAYPPAPADLDVGLQRLERIVHSSGAEVVVTTTDLAALREVVQALPAGKTVGALPWIDAAQPASPGRAAHCRPEDVAFLQYTSGSTSRPRGVMLTHRNLLENERQITAVFGMAPSDVVVSWLPTYHDMGLVGCVLQPLYAGIPGVMMSPLAFLQRPVRWLEAISAHHGSVSGGPNFAYELCASKVREEDLSGLELGSWRVAFNGAEPIRPRTLEAFTARFSPVGFRAEAFLPCYGLAEASVLVTGRHGGGRLVTVDRLALEESGEVRPVADPAAARTLVTVGGPAPGVDLAIVDPETGSAVPDGQVGEVLIQGPNVTSGYWGRDGDEHPDLFAGGGYLRTGDLGFLHDGELVITGRGKEQLIIRGRNIDPYDIEDAAQSARPGLRAGGGAAFDGDGPVEPGVVLVQEVVVDPDGPGLDEIVQAIRAAVTRHTQVALTEVVLVAPRSVPKTSSGKIQRRACRDTWQRGGLAVVHAWRTP